MEFRTPGWVRDAVFYQIFPDRFARSAGLAKPANLEPWDAPPTLYGFKGGDLDGVRDQLGYLEDLGVNALYLTPVFSSTANHRYHTYDYMTVDPLLGGNVALGRLLESAHARHMHVVLDGVFNHASRGFFQFNHTLENGAASPYVDWFHFNRAWLRSGKPLDAYATLPRVSHPPAGEHSMSLYGYRAWWDIPALPKFNTANPEVREFLLGVAEHWIGFGIDGWRLDVPSEIDDDGFWQEFRRRVKARNPEAYLCGEIWDDAGRWLRGDQFDGVMNYRLGKACLGFAFAGGLNHAQLARSGLADVRAHTAEEFAAALTDAWTRYPREAAECQLNLVSSHDTPRVINVGLGDEAGLGLVYTALFTVPGAPCVYYGDEVGLPGDHDPDNRRGFEWDKELWNHELRACIQELARARRASPALRRGDLRVLAASGGVVAYARQHGPSEAIVCLNAGAEPRELRLALAAAGLNAPAFRALRAPAALRRDADGSLGLTVPARQGVVLVSAP